MNFDRFNSLRAIAGIALILFWGIPCLATGLGYMYVIASISIIIGILLIVIPSKDEDANANDKKPSKPYDPNSYSNLRIHYSKVKSDNSIQELKDVLKEKTKMLLRAYMLDSQITDDELDRILEESYDEQMVNNKLSDHIPYCKPTVSEFSHNILSMTSKLLSEMEIPMLKALSIEYYAKETVAYATDETISEVISSFNQHAPRTLYFFRGKVNYELAALGLIMQYAIDQNVDAIADAVTDIRIARGYLPSSDAKKEAHKDDISVMEEFFTLILDIAESRHRGDNKVILEILVFYMYKCSIMLLDLFNKNNSDKKNEDDLIQNWTISMSIVLLAYVSAKNIVDKQELDMLIPNRLAVYDFILSEYSMPLGWDFSFYTLSWFISNNHAIFPFEQEDEDNQFLSWIENKTSIHELITEAKDLNNDFLHGTITQIDFACVPWFEKNADRLIDEILNIQ